jgi:hypothetical protein
MRPQVMRRKATAVGKVMLYQSAACGKALKIFC